MTNVETEIVEIMKVYHKQAARGEMGTAGGLEHMGDVWSLFLKWERRILAAESPAPAAPPQEREG